MDIVIVIWFFWFVFCMPCDISDIKNNPNYNRGRQDIKIIKDFIASGGCEKYDDLTKEVHDCTVKDNT